MSNHPQYLAWINESETGLATWIRRYLTKRGERVPDRLLEGSELGQLKNEIERWATTGPDADTTWKRLRQMNEAWTQQKIRDKRKKSKEKACSFVLSTATQKNLQKLTDLNQHGTNAACLEWLLQDSAAQFKATNKEKKEAKERHNAELRGQQSKIDALGHVLGHTLYELAISTTGLCGARKTCQTSTGAQEGEIEKAYEVACRNAIVRTSGFTRLSPKHIAGLIKRPSSEQIKTILANILPTETKQPSTSNVQPSNSIEQEQLTAENHGAMMTTAEQLEDPSKDATSIELITNSTSPVDAMELPAEREDSNQSSIQRTFSTEATLPKRKKLSTEMLNSISKLFPASE